MAMDEFPFSPKDVLFLLGYNISGTQKHAADIECPMCKGKKKLNFDFDKHVFRCNICEFSGNSLTFYANVMQMSNKDAFKDICERLSINKPVEKTAVHKVPEKKEEEVEETEIADIKVRHRTYTTLLQELKLSEKHSEDMSGRGFYQEFVVDRGYKTYPDINSSKDICVRLQQQGCTLKGVPMFYRDNYNKWTISHIKNGIIVPYRSFNNLIQGFQVRVDNELLEPDENKYKWCSSRYKTDGCKARTYIHYACDFLWDVNNTRYVPLCKNNTFLITEGAMKADLFFHLTGQPALALPGVNCTSLLEEELKNLKSIGVKKIILAYDMDFLMNIHVMKALANLRKIIIDMGFVFTILLWDCKMTYQDKTPVEIPVLKDGYFNIFVFTKKTLEKAIEQNQIEIILSGLNSLGIKNVFYSIKDVKNPEELKMWETFKKLFAGFTYKPVLWDLTYKGIDDYYAHKIRG